MKTYRVTLVYTSYAHYEFQANSEDEAEQMAWDDFDKGEPDRAYGEWETSEVEQL